MSIDFLALPKTMFWVIHELEEDLYLITGLWEVGEKKGHGDNSTVLVVDWFDIRWFLSLARRWLLFDGFLAVDFFLTDVFR